jgi:Fe-S-cluster containining protein
MSDNTTQSKPRRTLFGGQTITGGLVAETHTPSKAGVVIDDLGDSMEELPKKVLDKFHLPVLQLNNPDYWPSKPKEERMMLTDEKATAACLTKCCGVDGLKAGCCHVSPNNMQHVLGPVTDDWIKEILAKFRHKGIKGFTRQDVVIDYEEGRLIGERFFDSHPVFFQKSTYPILRIAMKGTEFACRFLAQETGKCTIYADRPSMCRNYYCEYLKTNYTIRLPSHPNTYTKVR